MPLDDPPRGTAASVVTLKQMSASTVVILAAGRGTRMHSATPKLAHELCGRPLLAWPVAAAQAAGAGRVVVVVGADDALAELIGEGVDVAVQQQALGTADAVAAAAGLIDRDARRDRAGGRRAAGRGRSAARAG